jgi:hypothetical protein
MDEDYGENELAAPPPEDWVYRQIEVHAEDEMICLSVENCSFNLPAEEANNGNGGQSHLSPSDNDLDEFGWSYDPQFYRPAETLGIRPGRYCLNLARSDSVSTRILTTEVAWDLLEAVTGSRLGRTIGQNEFFSASLASEILSRRENDQILEQQEPWLMLDADTTILDGGRLVQYTSASHCSLRPGESYVDEDGRAFYYGEAFYDRFGDVYIHRRFEGEDGQRRGYPLYTRRQLVKIRPEKTDMRKQYMESATLRSPKKINQSTTQLPWIMEDHGQSSLDF